VTALLTTWWVWAAMALAALLTTWWVWAAMALAALLAAKRHERMCLAALRRWSAECDLHEADRSDLYRAWRIRDAALAEARRWKTIAMQQHGIEWQPRGYRLTRGR